MPRISSTALWWLKMNTAGRCDQRCDSPVTRTSMPASAVPSSPHVVAATFAQRVEAPLYAFRLAGAEHLRDGQVVSSGDLRVVAVHTPGHTSDHVAFHLPTEGALFAGDAVLGRGTSFIDPPDGDLAQYLRTLRRMQELGARTIYPGHGPVVLDAPAKLRQYIDHRAEREQQVVGALSNGPRTIEEMVSEIYAAYPRELRELAARSVLAHLLKLSAEGRVAQRGRGDAATWEAGR